MKPDIVRRYAHNPILTKADIPVSGRNGPQRSGGEA
jgi:hypothetical protein